MDEDRMVVKHELSRL